MFNSSINGIEDSDLILLIGTNPRFEATILNTRIRKSYLNNSTKIISLNDVGDLTYPYEALDGQTKTILDIFEGTSSKLSVNSSSFFLVNFFFSLAITKQTHANTLSWAEKALVEATPISGPAAIDTT